MNDVWQDNLEFLKNTAAALYDKALKDEDDTGLEVLADGRRRLVKVKKDGAEVSLGSIINPEREARRLFADSDENAGLLIVLGVGNLKLLDAAKRRFRRLQRLIIVEPSAVIFRALLREIPLKKIFAAFPKTDISIVLGEDLSELNNWYKMFIFNYPLEAVATLIPVGYALLFPLYRKKLAEFDRDAQLQLGSTIRTHQAFRYMWHVNQWRNLKLRSAHFAALGEIVKKLPVIIVSAGPSLDRNISLLKETGDRAFIIACGSAIRILHGRGIVPHLRLSIEGNSLQERLFAGIDPNECPLGYTDFINGNIARAYDGNCLEIFAVHNYPLKSILMRSVGITVGETSSGASVSNLAVFLAQSLGARKIILTGQDLCWQQDKNYAEGGWASASENKRAFTYSNRFLVRNMYGQEVYTGKGFINIKLTLEHLASLSRDTHFINASEGGLAIAGFESKRLLDVVAEDLPAEPPVADLRRTVKESIESQLLNRFWSQEDVREVYSRYRDEVKGLREDFARLEDLLAREGAKAGRSLRNRYEKLLKMPLYQLVFANGLSA